MSMYSIVTIINNRPYAINYINDEYIWDKNLSDLAFIYNKGFYDLHNVGYIGFNNNLNLAFKQSQENNFITGFIDVGMEYMFPIPVKSIDSISSQKFTLIKLSETRITLRDWMCSINASSFPECMDLIQQSTTKQSLSTNSIILIAWGSIILFIIITIIIVYLLRLRQLQYEDEYQEPYFRG